MTGRKATAEEAQRANAAAHALVQKIGKMHLPEATGYVRQNPQSSETVANLAFYAMDLYAKLVAAQKRHLGGVTTGKRRHDEATSRIKKIYKYLDDGYKPAEIAGFVRLSAGYIRYLRRNRKK